MDLFSKWMSYWQDIKSISISIDFLTRVLTDFILDVSYIVFSVQIKHFFCCRNIHRLMTKFTSKLEIKTYSLKMKVYELRNKQAIYQYSLFNAIEPGYTQQWQFRPQQFQSNSSCYFYQAISSFFFQFYPYFGYSHQSLHPIPKYRY